MKIKLVRKTSYTALSNTCIQTKKLSLKAKGLLALMLSLPDDWEYSISGLVAMCQEGERAVTAALDELKKHGYVVVKKYLPNETASKRFEYEYIVSDQPMIDEYEDSQKLQNAGQDLQNQDLQNQHLQNVPLAIYNNKINNTKETRECSLHSHSLSARETKPRFAVPTVKEVQEYCASRHNSVNAEEFVAHYDSNGWCVGKTPMKDWRAAVRTWEFKRKKTTSTRITLEEAQKLNHCLSEWSEEDI